MSRKSSSPKLELKENAPSPVRDNCIATRDGSVLRYKERRGKDRKHPGIEIVEVLEGGLEIVLATSTNNQSAGRLCNWIELIKGGLAG